MANLFMAGSSDVVLLTKFFGSEIIMRTNVNELSSIPSALSPWDHACLLSFRAARRRVEVEADVFSIFGFAGPFLSLVLSLALLMPWWNMRRSFP